MGSDGRPCCACLSVAYDPERLEDGLCRERWVCQTCGVEFARKPFLEARLSALEAERDAALERVRELTEWRPMETAPRDGDSILLLENDGNKALAYWSADAEAWASASGYGSRFWADDDYYNGWSHTPPAP